MELRDELFGLSKINIFTEKFSKIITLIGIGLLVIASVVFIIFSKIGNENIGLLGDTIGGIIGSIWALAGVILFYVALTDQRNDILINREALKQQIKEFELQRKELEDTRKEYQLNRITTLVYNQLERVDKCIRNLNINRDGRYDGFEAIQYLYKNRTIFNQQEFEEKNDYNDRIIKSIQIHIEILYSNKDNFSSFCQNFYHTVNVLRSLLYSANIELSEKNFLKNIFFLNIGNNIMGILENIVSNIDESQNFEIDDEHKLLFRSTPYMDYRYYLNEIIEFSNTPISNQ